MALLKFVRNVDSQDATPATSKNPSLDAVIFDVSNIPFSHSNDIDDIDVYFI